MWFILLLPFAFGLLLWWVIRQDRQKQFIRNRLNAFVPVKTEPLPLIRKLRYVAASYLLLPKEIRDVLNAAFEAAGNTVRFLHLVIAALVTASLIMFFANFVLGLSSYLTFCVGIIASAIIPILVLRFAQARYRRRFLDIFPDALDLVGRGVKAGLPVNEALYAAGREMADPVGSELRRAFDQVQIGVPMIDALQTTADRVRVADFRFMVVALALQQKTGGSLAETLGNLSTVIRARKALRLKARALSAEAKVSAMILASLPFVMGAFMFVTSRDLSQALFYDPRGRFMLGMAFISLTTGMSTMYIMVKRAVR